MNPPLSPDTIHPDIFGPAVALLTRSADSALKDAKAQQKEGRIADAEASTANAQSYLHAVAILSD